MLRLVRTVFTNVLAMLLCLGAAYSGAASGQHKASSTSSTSAKKKSASTKKPLGNSNASKKGGSTGKRSSGVQNKQSAKGSAAKKGSTSRSARRGKKGAKAKPAARGQQAPTPERVKEIQQALIDRGYLKGEASGVWGQDSVDALRRFQGDKNLEATGKLSSLSLIHLGLGPKRAATAQPGTEQHP